MANMFFAGIPLEGSGAKQLDADLYGAEQQGADHENLSATGNLNIGNVLNYDEHAVQHLTGGNLSDGENRLMGLKQLAKDFAGLPDAISGSRNTQFASDNSPNSSQSSAGSSAFQNFTPAHTENFAGTPAPTPAVSGNTVTSPSANNSNSNSQTQYNSSHTGNTTTDSYNTYNTTTNTYNYNNTETNTENNTYNNSNSSTTNIGGSDLITIGNITIDNNNGNGGGHGHGGTTLLETVTNIVNDQTSIVNTITNNSSNTTNELIGNITIDPTINTTLNQIVNVLDNNGHGGNGPVTTTINQALTDITSIANNAVNGGSNFLQSIVDKTDNLFSSINNLISGAGGATTITTALNHIGGDITNSLNIVDHSLNGILSQDNILNTVVNDVGNTNTISITTIAGPLAENLVNITGNTLNASTDFLSNNEILNGNLLSGDTVNILNDIKTEDVTNLITSTTINTITGIEHVAYPAAEHFAASIQNTANGAETLLNGIVPSLESGGLLSAVEGTAIPIASTFIPATEMAFSPILSSVIPTIAGISSIAANSVPTTENIASHVFNDASHGIGGFIPAVETAVSPVLSSALPTAESVASSAIHGIVPTAESIAVPTSTGAESMLSGITGPNIGGAESAINGIVAPNIGGAESSVGGIITPAVHDIMPTIENAAMHVMGLPQSLDSVGDTISSIAGPSVDAINNLSGGQPLLDIHASSLTQALPLADGDALINGNANLASTTDATPQASGMGLVSIDVSALSTPSSSNVHDGASMSINANTVTDPVLSVSNIPVVNIDVPLPTASEISPALPSVLQSASDTGSGISDATSHAIDSAMALSTLSQSPTVAAVDGGVLFTGGTASVGHGDASTPAAPVTDLHVGHLIQGLLGGHH